MPMFLTELEFALEAARKLQLPFVTEMQECGKNLQLPVADGS